MKLLWLITIFTLLTPVGYAQSHLRLDIDESKGTYVKGFVRAQLWGRYMDMNPGTTINGELVDNKIDFSIRRLRVGLVTQLTSRLFVFTMFGGNNLNFRNQKRFDFDLLDFTVEYKFAEAFSFGIGENAWNGLSRWTTRSTKSLMALDAPLFSLFTVNKNDDLTRMLGIWAKGQIGKFDYNVALQNPADFGEEAQEGKTDFALNNPSLRSAGYIKYEFLDNESNLTAYSGTAGTYIGKKRVFNIGGGFQYQPEMMSSIVNDQVEFYDYRNWAVEAFYDAPINTQKGNAITTYLGYFNTDFGPNYIRNLGANGYASGGTSFNGAGNAFPMMGTGSTVFFQLGYLFSKKFLGSDPESPRLQPNIAIQYSDFEALDDAVVVVDVGVNLFFKGHGNKLTISYQDRPVFDANFSGALKVNERKGQLVMQYQILID